MSSTVIFPYDLYYIFAAGKVLLEGGNPYDPATYSAALYAIGWPLTEGVQVITQPPFYLWIYALLALLPFTAAVPVWLLANALGMFFCFRFVEHDKPFRKDNLGRDNFIFAMLLFPPVIFNIQNGQVNFIALIGLVGFLHFWRTKRDVLTGACLALSLFKPHLLIAFYAYFGFEILRERRFLIPITAVLLMAAGVAMTFLLSPISIAGYGVHVKTIVGYEFYGASPVQSLATLTGFQLLRPLALLLVCSYALYDFLRRGFSVERAVYFYIPLSLLTAPYMWAHSLILLVYSYRLLLEKLFISYPRAAKPIILLFGLSAAYFNIRTEWEWIWGTLVLIQFLL